MESLKKWAERKGQDHGRAGTESRREEEADKVSRCVGREGIIISSDTHNVRPSKKKRKTH